MFVYLARFFINTFYIQRFELTLKAGRHFFAANQTIHSFVTLLNSANKKKQEQHIVSLHSEAKRYTAEFKFKPALLIFLRLCQFTSPAFKHFLWSARQHLLRATIVNSGFVSWQTAATKGQQLIGLSLWRQLHDISSWTRSDDQSIIIIII